MDYRRPPRRKRAGRTDCRHAAQQRLRREVYAVSALLHSLLVSNIDKSARTLHATSLLSTPSKPDPRRALITLLRVGIKGAL